MTKCFTNIYDSLSGIQNKIEYMDSIRTVSIKSVSVTPDTHNNFLLVIVYDEE
jgi:hypothetical protein